jgi:hypothetical protein
MIEDNMEYESAMHELLTTNDEESLGRVIAGVLEFLTGRAVVDAPFYIITDDENAIAVFAAENDAKDLRAALPGHYKSWDDELDEPEFITNADLGDEQDESATESE